MASTVKKTVEVNKTQVEEVVKTVLKKRAEKFWEAVANVFLATILVVGVVALLVMGFISAVNRLVDLRIEEQVTPKIDVYSTFVSFARDKFESLERDIIEVNNELINHKDATSVNDPVVPIVTSWNDNTIRIYENPK